ncbi:MAG: hypothetical protein ACR2PF_17635 [Rhizobiaceae bacterium]
MHHFFAPKEDARAFNAIETLRCCEKLLHTDTHQPIIAGLWALNHGQFYPVSEIVGEGNVQFTKVFVWGLNHDLCWLEKDAEIEK